MVRLSTVPGLCLTLLLYVAMPRAHADEAARASPQETAAAEKAGQAGQTGGTSRPLDRLDWSFLYDGGAVPFLWLPAAGAIALALWVEPPETPLFFDPDEGGAPSHKDREIPDWQVAVGAVVLDAYIALGTRHESRWFHAKGLAESLITSNFVVTIGKVTVGRHRPDYDPAIDSWSGRRSFPSGHSSNTLAATTYLALYLRYHGFDGLRPPGTMPWWEGLTYGGLAVLSVYVPYTRVRDNRHHPSDVLTGAVLGSVSSLAFFYWQERRYRRAAGQPTLDLERSTAQPIVVPDLAQRTLWLRMQF